MLHDAHLHIECDELIDQMRQHKILGIANASTTDEYLHLKKLQEKASNLWISAGIHPWKAETTSWEDMDPILHEVKIIGEIGLDNVWCDSDEDIQKHVFEKQLQLAYQCHKPVILHTKGMEKEVLDRIKCYPNTYLVHWYSCTDYIEKYTALDCYFTIGPSVGNDEAVNQLVQKVPLDRLLIETDGLNAVAWANGKDVDIKDYTLILKRSITQIALLRKIDEQLLNERLQDNFMRFIGKTKKSSIDFITG